MPSYAYKAIDKNTDKNISDTIQADSQEQAKTQLRAKNILVLNIKPATEENNNSPYTSKFKSTFNSQKLMLFTRQFSTLLSSGMEVDAALKLIATQTDGKDVQNAINAIRDNLSEGMTLSQSMQRASKAFPKDYLATIAAGEETGHMIKVIDKLADEVEHSAKNMQGLMSALMYPIIMLSVAMLVILMLMTYVVPQIADVFINMKHDLPLMTVVLIAISNFLLTKGIYLLIVIVVSVVAFIWRLKTSVIFKTKVHKTIIGLPMFGKLVLSIQIGRWSRSFGMLLESGIPTLQALHISLQTVTNQYIYDILQSAIEKVREGQPLHLALQSSKVIPFFLIHMCSSGEASGNLGAMMSKTSDYYIHSVRTTTETTIKLFEPILIVVMGGIVMVIVLAVLLPIFELNSML